MKAVLTIQAHANLLHLISIYLIMSMHIIYEKGKRFNSQGRFKGRINDRNHMFDFGVLQHVPTNNILPHKFKFNLILKK